MKFESILNLVLVSVLSYSLGKRYQKKNNEEEEAEKTYKKYVPYPESNRKKTLSNDEPLSFIFSTKKEAEEILGYSVDAISKYGRLTVADVYEMVGVTSSFSDNLYGWYGPAGMTIRASKGGQYNSKSNYVLEYPKAQKLD